MNRIYNQRKKATFQFTDSKQSHLITTDDARVGELGLSSFTTGILYDWMFLSNNGFVRKNLDDIQEQYSDLQEQSGDTGAYLKQELSNYRNLSVFDHNFISAFGADGNEARWPTEVFLKSSTTREDERCSQTDLENYLFFYGWRNEGRNGEYKLFNKIGTNTDWTFTDVDNTTYTWNNLNIEAFEDDENFPLFNSNSDRIIQQIIKMNDEVNQKQGEDLTDATDKARRAFIYDIRSSKFGCLQWTSTLRFLLADPQTLTTAGIDIAGCDNCAKTVSVDFKLFLYDDEFNIREGQNTLVPNNTMFALPKSTPTGRQYVGRDETGMDSLNIQNTPANATAAELRTNYVEYDGKFESGTSQIFAIMTTDLEASEHPSIESIEDGDEAELLSKTQGFSAPTGKAVIISMQNGNPKQWMPNFTKDRRCRKESSDEDVNKKEEVTVVNITQRAYSKGDSVILQKLDGVWVPSFAGPGGDSTTRVENIDPQWQFMYLMTNSRFFFRNKAGEKITPSEYESSFYNAYYTDDDLNYLQHGYKTTGKADVDNGYFQCTSWDFMGAKIGGTRRKDHSLGYIIEGEQILNEEFVEDGDNGNALSNTQALFNTKNEQFSGDDVQFNSYPFFGCVFPGGYSAQKQYGELTEPDKNFFLNFKNYEHDDITVPFHYATTGNPFTNDNNVVNILNSEPQNLAQSAGMFDGETGDLKHLPADIGTNASPSGKYGQPVSNIALIGELNKNIGDIDIFRSGIGTYFAKDQNEQPNRYSWMYKQDISTTGQQVGEDDPYGYLDSAFDLQPANYLTIQFRPLSAEVYACMEGWEWTHKQSGPPTILANFQSAVDRFNRGELAKEASNFTQKGRSGAYAPPISSHAVARNKHIVIDPNSTNNEKNLYNVAANNTNPNYNANGLRYKPDLIKSGDDSLAYREDFPISWWDDNWVGGGVGNVDNSLGGIGIIGAVVSVATLDTLQLNTQNRVGIDDQLQGSSWTPTWEDVEIGAQNTIGLHAKVYQKWPREYTIYDPRFFVVHHFNKDVEIQDKDIEQEYYLDGNVVDTQSTEQVYPTGNYSVDKKESDLDIRIPTYYNKEAVTTGEFVYNDSEIREKSDWNIDKQRRGKLLPYSYKFNTIGIGGVTDTLAEGGSVGNCDIVIINGGEGYSAADTFTVSRGSAGGVVLKPVVGSTIDTVTGETVFNTIVDFEVLSSGAGFSKEDFLSESEVETISWNTGDPQPALGSLRIQDGSNVSGGTGLEAYVVRGKVVEATATDIKPPQVLLGNKGEILVSAQKGGDSAGQEVQVEANINQVFEIDPELKQENNQYDVFLHFHNDITQNRVTDPGSAPRQAEQHITLQILNNNGASTSVQVDESSQPGNIALSDPSFNANGVQGLILEETVRRGSNLSLPAAVNFVAGRLGFGQIN